MQVILGANHEAESVPIIGHPVSAILGAKPALFGYPSQEPGRAEKEKKRQWEEQKKK